MSHDEDGFNGASASWIANADVLGGWDKAPIGVPIIPQVSAESSAGIPQETSLTELVRLMMERGCSPAMILMATALFERNSSGIPRNSSGTTQEIKDFQRAERVREKDRERKRLAKMKGEKGAGIPRNGVSGDYISSSLLSEENTKKEVETGNTRARGCALPDGWQPKPKHFEQAEALGFQRAFVLDQAEDMRNWALANRNRAVARKADWDLTFTGWMKRNKGGSNVRSGSGLPNSARQSHGRSNGITAALDQLIDGFERAAGDERETRQAPARLLPNGGRE